MSFIHEALKKAQQLKDGSYSSYGTLISGPQQPVRGESPGTGSRARWALILLTLAVLACAAAIVYQESSGINFSGRKNSGAGTQQAPPVRPPEPRPQASAPNAADTAALYQEALKGQLANDNAKAESLYRQVIASNPGHADALNNLGVILMSGGKTQEAVELFNRAVSLNPDFADAYYNLACSNAKLGQVESGLKFLEQAVRIKPGLAAFASRDEDMKNLRSSPKFNQVINKKGRDKK
jgi:tetratricopeptide (TPR) repeat protein